MERHNYIKFKSVSWTAICVFPFIGLIIYFIWSKNSASVNEGNSDTKTGDHYVADNNSNDTSNRDYKPINRDTAAPSNLEDQLVGRDLIVSKIQDYSENKISAKDVVDAFESFKDNFLYEQTWGYYILKVKAEDMEYILGVMVNDVNATVASRTIGTFVHRGILLDMDVDGLIAKIPEGEIRYSAVRSIFKRGEKTMLKYAKTIVDNELIDSNLWDQRAFPGEQSEGFQACSNETLSKFFAMLQGPGKSLARSVMINRAFELKGGIADVAQYMNAEVLPSVVKNDVYVSATRKMNKGDLLNFDLSKIPTVIP